MFDFDLQLFRGKPGKSRLMEDAERVRSVVLFLRERPDRIDQKLKNDAAQIIEEQQQALTPFCDFTNSRRSLCELIHLCIEDGAIAIDVDGGTIMDESAVYAIFQMNGVRVTN